MGGGARAECLFRVRLGGGEGEVMERHKFMVGKSMGVGGWLRKVNVALGGWWCDGRSDWWEVGCGGVVGVGFWRGGVGGRGGVDKVW